MSAEIAAIFRRSDRTIREWVRKGKLRQLKIGRSVFFVAEDVRQLVAEGLSKSLPAGSAGPGKRLWHDRG